MCAHIQGEFGASVVHAVAWLHYKNDYFNQRLGCAAPKYWSKYTTTLGKLPWKSKVPLQKNGMATIPKILLHLPIRQLILRICCIICH